MAYSAAAATAMTPWWAPVVLMASSFRRSASTTTVPAFLAWAARRLKVRSVSPLAMYSLSTARPARRASVTALRPSIIPSVSRSSSLTARPSFDPKKF